MGKDPSLSSLRTYVRLVERGSLSAAARDMGTTQPTVSRQLQELESAYGAALIVRTTRSLRMTPAGTLVYEQARLILQADESLRERLATDSTHVSGRIQVAAPSGFGAFVVTPFCGDFVKRHPDATIDVRLTDRQVDLVGDGTDVAIRIGRLADSSLFAQPLGRLDEVVVAHPALLDRAVRRPADLERLLWILFSGLKAGADLRLARGTRAHKLSVAARMSTDQIVAHREALLAGAGVGVIHLYAVQADIDAGRLSRLLPEWTLPAWPMHALFPVRTPPNRVRVWCSELKAALASVPGVCAR